MKVPPKRKGNIIRRDIRGHVKSLNESPSEKEGKLCLCYRPYPRRYRPSMKVPPKRKGNSVVQIGANTATTLNESPSEKEGK